LDFLVAFEVLTEDSLGRHPFPGLPSDIRVFDFGSGERVFQILFVIFLGAAFPGSADVLKLVRFGFSWVVELETFVVIAIVVLLVEVVSLIGPIDFLVGGRRE
jgi:hypothetical protein